MAKATGSPAKRAKTEYIPSSDEENGIFTVERIVQKRVDRRGKVFYLIKWKDYPSSQNTWEPAESIFSPSLIEEFEEAEKRRLGVKKPADKTEEVFNNYVKPVPAQPQPAKTVKPKEEVAVVDVKTVTRDKEDPSKLANNEVIMMPTSEANLKYPQLMLKFYEARLTLKEHKKKKMRIAVEGCCHGELHKIYASLAQETEKVDLLIICGDFQAIRNARDLECLACPPKYRQMGDFVDYFSGAAVAPVLTLFIGGNHEAANHLNDLYYGGWVCPNIYYLGHAGVVNFGGLRIAGISGIFYGRDFRIGYHEREPFTGDMIRSAYHYREFEIEKLKKIKEPIDIFISHEWPTGIYNFGDKNALLRRKPYFRDEVERNVLGAKPLENLLKHLKPKNWFSAHMHVAFEATVPHPNSDQVTKFLALDKCLPKREFMRVINFPPSKANEGLKQLTYDCEWIGILKQAEPFISRSPGPWMIDAKFFKESVQPIASDCDLSIPIPPSFDLTSAQKQTAQFKKRFEIIAVVNLESVVQDNPEEIQIDL